MPIDFTNIQTTRGRQYDAGMISRLNDSLQALPIKQRAAILGSVIEESGGDPLAKSENGTYQGLLQWGKDRYRIASNDREREFTKQIQLIRNTLNDSTDQISWTHGGEGSGYSSFREPLHIFHNSEQPLKDVYRAFSYGYVRPKGKEDSYSNRLKVVQQVYDRLKTQPATTITKQDIVNAAMIIPNTMATGVSNVVDFVNQAVQKYVKSKDNNKENTTRWAEGGYLKPKDAWDALSMKDKAAMMEVAVRNGITSLKDIKDKYNEFAEGGDTGPLEYTHQRFPVTKEFDIAPYKDSSFTPEGMGNIEYMSAKHDTLPYYNNYQKPDSLKGRSVVVYNDRMGDTANEAIALDILSHGLREQDPTWRRKYLPTLTDAFEGDAIYNMTDKDRKIYNLNDPEDRGEVIDNYIDDYIRAMAVDDKYRKALNYAPRSILNKEYNTLPPEQQNALAEAYSYIYPTRLPDVIVYGKKHSIGGPLVEDVMNEYKDGGGIHIKPSKKGTFTAAAKKHGKSVQAFASQVLAHPENYSPAMRKKANFARNARKWKHGLGGNLFLTGGPEEKGRGEVTNLSTWDELAAQSPLFYTIGKAIDPTGVSGYGDAREAINQYDSSPSLSNGYTAVMETLGALPIVSKAGKAIKFLQGAVTGQGVFDDYNYAQEKKKEYGDELVVDYWDNTVKPRREAEKHGEQMKSKMAYTDVHHVPSFKLAPKGSKSGQIISDYDINHRVVKKYKKVFSQ